MRIKEVCEKTGLTDRAIRLYMENGLVVPKQEYNYMGRRSISFDEEDIRVLEDVATLRQAGFSIADIAQMQMDKSCLPERITEHRQKLSEEIKGKQRILDALMHYDITREEDYHKLAAVIRTSTSSNTILKEEFGMNLREIRNMMRKRIPALLSLLILVFGLCYIGSLVIKTAFADVYLSSGGGYTLDYNSAAWWEHAMILCAVLSLVVAIVPLLISLAGGRRYWMLISTGFVLIAGVLLLFMPAWDEGRIHLFEFVFYRKLLRNTFLYNTNDPPAFLIKSIKYLPLISSAVLSCIGFWIDGTFFEGSQNK